MFGAVVFLGVLSVISGQTTDVSQCISHEGDLPIHTSVEGCQTPPCQLPQQQDVVVNLVFRATHTMRSMRTLATAYMSLGPISIPYNYDLEENAITCNFLTNTYCPVLQDEVVQYTLKMHIESWFPVGTAVTLEFRVVDNTTATQTPVLCIRVPIRVVAPLSADARNGTDNNMLIAQSELA